MPRKKEIEFVRLALQKTKLSLEQVEECFELQRKSSAAGEHPKPLVLLLQEKGYLSRREAKSLLKETEDPDYSDSESDAPLNEQLAGYQLLEKLGEGAMGVVYKARQLSTQRIVALKVLSETLAGDPHFIERFCQEARNAAKLRHENIVAAYDVGEWQGRFYFAMEFIKGQSLAEVLYRKGRLPPNVALTVTRQVARALAHAHQFSIVHRDIKAENILISKNGVVKLCDLGLAKDLSMERLSPTGSMVGTPYYISPEQARGAPDVDIRSDIYSLGICLYFMLTGELPYLNTVIAKKAVLEKGETLPPLRQKLPSASAGLVHLLQNMTAKNRAQRYQTPSQLLQDINIVMRGGDPGICGVSQTSSSQIEQEDAFNNNHPSNPNPFPLRGEKPHMTTTTQLRLRKRKIDWYFWGRIIIGMLVLALLVALLFVGYNKCIAQERNAPLVLQPAPAPCIALSDTEKREQQLVDQFAATDLRRIANLDFLEQQYRKLKGKLTIPQFQERLRNIFLHFQLRWHQQEESQARLFYQQHIQPYHQQGQLGRVLTACADFPPRWRQTSTGRLIVRLGCELQYLLPRRYQRDRQKIKRLLLLGQLHKAAAIYRQMQAYGSQAMQSEASDGLQRIAQWQRLREATVQYNEKVLYRRQFKAILLPLLQKREYQEVMRKLVQWQQRFPHLGAVIRADLQDVQRLVGLLDEVVQALKAHHHQCISYWGSEVKILDVSQNKQQQWTLVIKDLHYYSNKTSIITPGNLEEFFDVLIRYPSPHREAQSLKLGLFYLYCTKPERRTRASTFFAKLTTPRLRKRYQQLLQCIVGASRELEARGWWDQATRSFQAGYFPNAWNCYRQLSQKYLTTRFVQSKRSEIKARLERVNLMALFISAMLHPSMECSFDIHTDTVIISAKEPFLWKRPLYLKGDVRIDLKFSQYAKGPQQMVLAGQYLNAQNYRLAMQYAGRVPPANALWSKRLLCGPHAIEGLTIQRQAGQLYFETDTHRRCTISRHIQTAAKLVWYAPVALSYCRIRGKLDRDWIEQTWVQ